MNSILFLIYYLVPELKEELSQSREAIVRHMQDFKEHSMVQLYGCATFAAMTAECKPTTPVNQFVTLVV